jgi:hypothetical protein
MNELDWNEVTKRFSNSTKSKYTSKNVIRIIFRLCIFYYFWNNTCPVLYLNVKTTIKFIH